MQTNQHLLNRLILLILLFILIPLLSAAGLSKLGDWKIADNISFGERILLPKVCIKQNTKKQGIINYQNSKFPEAESNFNSSLSNCKNDPESLIYKNNSKIGDNKSITIAALVPISRKPNNALEMLRGFAKAQDDINKVGGVNGLPLKIAIIDDEDNPNLARKISRKISKDPNYLGAIGHWTSDVSLAASNVYNFQKMPFITPISTTNKLSENNRDYTHQVNITNFEGAGVLAEYAKNQRKKNIAIFYTSRATYSQEIKKRFNDEFQPGSDTKVVAEFDFSHWWFNPFKSVKKANNEGVEAILIATDNKSVDKAYEIIKAVKKENSDILLLGDLANLYSRETLKLDREADGMVMAVSWHKDIDYTSKNFSDESEKLWGGAVNYATAMSYDAVQAFVQATKNAKEITCENVNQELNNDNFTFQGSTDSRGMINDKVKLVRIEEGKFVYFDFKEVN